MNPDPIFERPNRRGSELVNNPYFYMVIDFIIFSTHFSSKTAKNTLSCCSTVWSCGKVTNEIKSAEMSMVDC